MFFKCVTKVVNLALSEISNCSKTLDNQKGYSMILIVFGILIMTLTGLCSGSMLFLTISDNLKQHGRIFPRGDETLYFVGIFGGGPFLFGLTLYMLGKQKK